MQIATPSSAAAPALALILLAGAVGDCTQRTPAQPTRAGAWSALLHVSGGFAGSDLDVSVSSSGRATVTDRRRNIERTEQLEPGELASIAALVASAKAPPAVRPAPCPDCFGYVLTIERNGELLKADLNDSSLSASGLQALVEALRTLQTRLLNK